MGSLVRRNFIKLYICMFFVHALYLQPYLWPRTVPKRQEHNSGQQFTLYYDQLARGRFLFNFPKQKRAKKKTLFALMSSNTTWPVSGRLRASPSAPAYARSCARPAGIRFAPRSCLHRPELVVFTAGDDGNGRRQGHAGMHPRARGIYNDPVVPRRHAGSSCPAGNGMLLARAVVVATASTSAAARMPLRRRPPPPRRISSRRAHARSDLRSGRPVD